MKTGIIYLLIDPRSNKIRYVGQTFCKPQRRFSQHLYQWKRSKGRITKVNSWIKNLDRNNLTPIMLILEESIPENKLNEKEIFYIDLYKNENLCNHTLGGQGLRNYKLSEESKIKRLETIKTSEFWKIKSIRHSEIMKEKYASGMNLGYGHLSEERRKEIGKNHSEKMKELYKNGHKNNNSKKVIVTNNKLSFEMKFDSINDVAKYFNISHSRVSKCVTGKNKSFNKGYQIQYDK